MLTKTIYTLAILAVVVLAAMTGFVLVFEGSRPEAEPVPAATPDDSRREVARKWNLPGGGRLRTGYVGSVGATFGNDEAKYSCIFRRGRLDRRERTFPFSAYYAARGMGRLVTVRLDVSGECGASLGDEAAWLRVAEVVPVKREEWLVAVLGEIDVSACSRMFRIEHVEDDGTTWSVGHSVPVAETWAGRAYDRWASWPPFRWLPDLRKPRADANVEAFAPSRYGLPCPT